ncbi:hypothetical protein PCE1_000754 [Barthelona sp. PCE]
MLFVEFLKRAFTKNINDTDVTHEIEQILSAPPVNVYHLIDILKDEQWGSILYELALGTHESGPLDEQGIDMISNFMTYTFPLINLHPVLTNSEPKQALVVLRLLESLCLNKWLEKSDTLNLVINLTDFLHPRLRSTSSLFADEYQTHITHSAVCCLGILAAQPRDGMREYFCKKFFAPLVCATLAIPAEEIAFVEAPLWQQDLVRLVGNVIYENISAIQSISDGESINTILSMTNFDKRVPHRKEWALFAIFSLTKHSETAVEYLKGLQALGVVENPTMDKLGMSAVFDENDKLQLVPKHVVDEAIARAMGEGEGEVIEAGVDHVDLKEEQPPVDVVEELQEQYADLGDMLVDEQTRKKIEKILDIEDFM